jgi:hypothetical protein
VTAAPKPKIFVYVQGRDGDGDLVGVALAEDGTVLAAHLSSSRSWFTRDMGLTSERKHDAYRAHYPMGYELVEVADDEAKDHPGLAAALESNRELVAASKDAER